MSRVQLSLNVNVTDFDAAVPSYSRLFGTALAKLRPGYANFSIAAPPLKLVLNGPAGLETKPALGAVCCYALQDKVWAHDPDGLPWEYCTVIQHVETP